MSWQKINRLTFKAGLTLCDFTANFDTKSWANFQLDCN